MKISKKIICLCLSLLVLIPVFSACGDKNEAEYNIGICQFSDHGALDSATKGFKDALTEKLGDKIAFTEKNATGGADEAIQICTIFANNKYDLIFANSTNALSAAANVTSSIPIVASSVTDFASTLGLQNGITKTGINVTGCSDMLPLEKQAAVIREIFPTAGSIGILYCSSETNSKYQADIIRNELTKYGYSCKDYTFVDTTDLSAVTIKASEECDVIFTPTDNTVASNTGAINNILEPAKIPLIAGNYDVAVECGIATVSIDYYDLGYKAGLMAYEILVNGKAPGEMEIGYADEYLKKYVPERAELLGIEIPEGYEAIK